METENMFMKRMGISIFLASALFGFSALLFGGTALAATAPTVSILKFDEGTSDPSDDTTALAAGYMANRVAVDSLGNVYVTDTDLNTINIFNDKGLLVRGLRAVTMPIGIAVGGEGKIYVGGVLNGYYKIFVVDRTGVVQGTLSGWPGSMPLDIEIDPQGNILGIDRDSGSVALLDKDGLLLNTFGPYLEWYDNDPDASLLVRTRTRHRLMAEGGLAVSPSGDIYLSIKEYVEFLTNSTSSTGCYVYGQLMATEDRKDSYKYYANTDSSYKYWCPVASRSAIAVIDRNGNNVKTKVGIDPYLSAGNYTLDAVEYSPVGLALDGNERLYVATVAGVRVYDAANISLLTPSGTFEGGSYIDVAFDAVNGRLVGAKTGTNIVNAYGIDGGTNPSNSDPAAPAPVSPIGTACVSSRTPDLMVANPNDPNFDALIYGYEVKDSSDTVVANATGIAEGVNGKTLMSLNVPLAENASYSWRAQAFDGYAAAWSDWATFRVNEGNDNPNTPNALSPVDNAVVSPFSSSLIWNSSADPDSACGDYVKEYMVEVAGEGFSKTFTTTVPSLRVGDMSDLKNGHVYSWRVKAVDSNGGWSDWGTASFTYRTTVVGFESSQPGTKVYIDGNYGYPGRLLGETPLTVEGISPGAHFVAFVKAGYEPFYQAINVVDDGTVLPVSANMVAASQIRPSAAGTEMARLGTGSSSPFVVDYNNDGLKDIIAGGNDGRVYLYLSEKQVHDGVEKVVLSYAGLLQADGADVNVGSRATPFVVDYNNDSRKDLLVGRGDGLIYLYLNTGEEVAPVFTLSGTIKDSAGNDIKVVSNSAPAVIDYNSDGKKDIILGGADGTLRLHLNIGTDSSPAFGPSYETLSADDSVLNIGSNSKPFFSDWNSDGKTDLLVGGGSLLRLYLNAGSNESPSFVFNLDIRDLTGGSGEVSPFVVDWEGTSARDIVAGNGLGSIVLYVSACGGNATGNTPPLAPTLLAPLNGDSVFSVMPVLSVANSTDAEGCPLTYGYEIKDGSGTVVATDSGIAESSDGKTSMNVEQALMENTTYYWRAHAFDGDTTTGTSWSGWNGSFCVNERNDSPGAPALISPLDNSAVSIFSTSLEWNVSADPDCHDTTSYYIEVSGSQSFVSALASRSLTGVSMRLEDLGVSMVNNGVYYWRVKAVDNNGGESAYSTGSFTYKTTVVRFESDQPGTKVYIDGNYGYLGRSLGSAPLEVEGITPGSHFVSFVKAGYDPVYKIVNVADPMVNGNALTVTASGVEWAVASKIATNMLGRQVFKTSGNSTPFVVDYNNDGLKDVIAGDADGNLYLYLSEEQLQADGSTKDVLVAKGALQNINVGSRAVPFAADYNNDGKKDFLVGSGDGKIYLYPNTGNDVAPVFTSATVVRDSSGSDIKVLLNSAPVIIDYNNDGRKDLVIGSSEGTLRLYLNVGADSSPEFSSAYVNIKVDGADLRDGTNSKAFFTDWNGDGKKDLLVGTGTGTVHLYLNVGSDGSPDFRSIAELQQWIMSKKKERGNTEYMPYSGYTQDIGDLTGGAGEASPFVVKWDDSPARDLMSGTATGGVIVYIPQTGQAPLASGVSMEEGRR